ncbi:MAG: Omp28-related outer membrane protein [Thermoplasmata archaeon]|nr:Omp28-related outer membrane protein [Thermoplasmata archaeon]
MSKLGASIVLLMAVAGLLTAPSSFGHSSPGISSNPGLPAASAHGSNLVLAGSPAPLVGYPRTVLVETFTGVWCIHCPAESSALYDIARNNSVSVLSIAELHACALAPPNPCYENYVPPDKTTDHRGIFYNVCGYPHVFFDGGHSLCGASNSLTQMKQEYLNNIANASNFPGNVSIAQSATLSGGGVSVQATISSVLTGSYNVVSYLMEDINKQNVSNGYGPHDIGTVVRETLINHPVSLTSGGSTPVSATGSLNASWNYQNLSVVSFVQDNSTKVVENANMVLVTSFSAAVSATQTTITSGTSTAIKVLVTNGTSSNPIAGATVSLSSNNGGTLSPASGVTASDGSFSSNFSAPTVTSATTVLISAVVTPPGFPATTETIALTINPIVVPAAATGLAVKAGNLAVGLAWTAPVSGGTGLAYHIYRSSSETGTFAQVGVAHSATFSDSGLVGAQTFWYTVSAQNSAGFSVNTSAVPATGLTVTAQGLPTATGWWLSIDNANFTSATSAPLSLYLPSGNFVAYKFGSTSYAYVAYGTTSPLTIAGVAFSIDAIFSPRYATLEGTVSPVTATVTANGASIAVVGGTYSDPSLIAGRYTVNVSVAGYVTNSTVVTLTPGNTTVKNFVLAVAPASHTTTSTGGLDQTETLAILGVVAVGAVAAVGGVYAYTRRGKGGSPPAQAKKTSRPPAKAPPKSE